MADSFIDSFRSMESNQIRSKTDGMQRNVRPKTSMEKETKELVDHFFYTIIKEIMKYDVLQLKTKVPRGDIFFVNFHSLEDQYLLPLFYWNLPPKKNTTISRVKKKWKETNRQPSNTHAPKKNRQTTKYWTLFFSARARVCVCVCVCVCTSIVAAIEKQPTGNEMCSKWKMDRRSNRLRRSDDDDDDDDDEEIRSRLGAKCYAIELSFFWFFFWFLCAQNSSNQTEPRLISLCRNIVKKKTFIAGSHFFLGRPIAPSPT